jgi:Domain of unknown function (DUF4304)
MANELAKAITKIIYPPLKIRGFKRHKSRRHDLIRVEDGIVQLLYFQVSGYGGRDFCVTACANLVAANEHTTLNLGFRLRLDPVTSRQWLPSFARDEALQSAATALDAVYAEALPFFEQVRSLEGFRSVLAKEQWDSQHHLHFQQGHAAALAGDTSTAVAHLRRAIELYEQDSRDWCLDYIRRARELEMALENGSAQMLLEGRYERNKFSHGIQ